MSISNTAMNIACAGIGGFTAGAAMGAFSGGGRVELTPASLSFSLGLAAMMGVGVSLGLGRGHGVSNAALIGIGALGGVGFASGVFIGSGVDGAHGVRLKINTGKFILSN